MSNSVSNDDKEALADLIQEEAQYSSWDYMYYSRDTVMGLIDKMVKHDGVR